MKPVEIPSLLRSVLTTLEHYGIVREGCCVPDISASVPDLLFGNAEGIRELLHIALGSFSGGDENSPLTIRISYTSGLLTFSFSPVQEPGGTGSLESVVRSLSGRLWRTGPEDRNGGSELCIEVPAGEDLPDTGSSGTTVLSSPCSLEAVISEVQDPEIALGILKDYTRHLREQIGRLGEALEQENLETVHREAHSIKGGAMNIRAPRLLNCAYRLEVAARNRRLENGSEMLENIEKAFREIADYVSTLPEG